MREVEIEISHLATSENVLVRNLSSTRPIVPRRETPRIEWFALTSLDRSRRTGVRLVKFEVDSRKTARGALRFE